MQIVQRFGRNDSWASLDQRKASLRSKRFRMFSSRSRHFSLFGGSKIGASATLMEGAGRGRGDEKRKRLPANPMILKNAPLTLSQLDKFKAWQLM